MFSLVPYKKYGDALNSHDLLKAIAITLMVLDHVGYYFMPYVTELRLVGRFSFPLFFFLIGYSHSYRFKWDVLVLSLVMVLQDAILHQPLLPTNILLNVIITRMILHLLDKKEWPTEFFITLAVILPLGYGLFGILTDFGVFGLVLALCGYFVRTRPNTKFTAGWMVLAYIAYSAIEITGFKFSFPYSIIFLFVLAIMLFLFSRYSLQVYTAYTCKNPAVHIVILLSRYSLYVYALHLMLFKWLRVWQTPELYTSFRWF